MDSVLPSGYVISRIEHADEIERLAACSIGIHDSGVGEMTRMLALKHPHADLIHWLAVIEERSGDIVSTLCLIPWTIRYAGIELSWGEMGIVGTREGFRRKGLIRALVSRFNKILADEKYVFSHIQGIPWFYRQFGYEYAVPLEANVNLEFRHIDKITGASAEQADANGGPAGAEQAGGENAEAGGASAEPGRTSPGPTGADSEAAGPGAPGPNAKTAAVRLRKASQPDIPLLDNYYQESMRDLGLYAERKPEIWAYLLGPSMDTDYAFDTYIVEASGEAVGYCRIPRKGFGDALILGECSRLPDDCFPGLYLRLRELAAKEGKPFIRVNLGPTHPAVLAAKDLGANETASYAWQIRLVDPAAFFRAITPVLESRLQESELAGYSGDFELFLYTHSIKLHFASGRISHISVLDADESPESGLRAQIPPNLLVPIVLGQRSYAECAAFYPDCRSVRKAARFLETLFPPMSGFFHCPY